MEEVWTDTAPDSIGPYSQGIKDGDRIYVSGQGPIDPDTETVEAGDIRDQTALTLENIAEILKAADASLYDVVKVNIYLNDMDNYDAVNEVYNEYMSEPYPARAVVEVSRFPVDIGIEIEAIASIV